MLNKNGESGNSCLIIIRFLIFVAFIMIILIHGFLSRMSCSFQTNGVFYLYFNNLFCLNCIVLRQQSVFDNNV
jgi:hypothetical protein